MAEGRLKRVDIDPSPDAVGGVGVPATVGIKAHISSPAPLGHPSGNPLTSHRPLTPVAGEYPFIRFAAAQAFKKRSVSALTRTVRTLLLLPRRSI